MQQNSSRAKQTKANNQKKKSGSKPPAVKLAMKQVRRRLVSRQITKQIFKL